MTIMRKPVIMRETVIMRMPVTMCKPVTMRETAKVEYIKDGRGLSCHKMYK